MIEHSDVSRVAEGLPRWVTQTASGQGSGAQGGPYSGACVLESGWLSIEAGGGDLAGPDDLAGSFDMASLQGTAPSRRGPRRAAGNRAEPQGPAATTLNSVDSAKLTPDAQSIDEARMSSTLTPRTRT
ncbi:hypothetical protein [Nannocystis punicea]|uniref:Uncharacterized protein n=1 Tax=Nannocystis punicea TaxID=2995304 RepID=A0ABY7GY66_9BACT|nr:hypothetical protein [Nannocystis poenicansa]WAS91835.1 hypothetical protein O0S08_37100 [Nannocystis poenicansa]